MVTAERLLKAICLSFAVLCAVRLGWPGLFGAWGRPFGVAWFEEPSRSSLLVDADLRMWGGLSFALAGIFLWVYRDLDRGMTVLRIIGFGALIAGAGRIYAAIDRGWPPWPAVPPIFLEVAVGITIFWAGAIYTRARTGEAVPEGANIS